MITQSRLGSLVEAGLNTLIGFAINYTANLLIFPLFGFHISLSANLLMGLIYTIISVIRGYLLRRYFNSKLTETAGIFVKWLQTN